MTPYMYIYAFVTEIPTRLFLFLVRNDVSYAGGWRKPIGYYTYHEVRDKYRKPQR